jgi:hypothetical protein
MKKVILSFVIIFTAIICVPPQKVMADDPKAREIMQKVEDRDDGDNMTSEMEMILIDKNNKKRIRKVSIFAKDKGEDDLSIMFFLHPPDVKDTGFLTHDFDDPDKDDDQFLYLPALKKPKRIASTDKSNAFMGTDLNYSDMTSRDLDDFDYTFYAKKKETEVNGHKVWVIESVPKPAIAKRVIDETGYKKTLIFVRQDNYVVVRGVMWEKRNGYVKYLDVKNLELIDGIWVATDMHVKRKKNKKVVHQTVLKISNIKFNQDLSEDMFTVRRLTKGL